MSQTALTASSFLARLNPLRGAHWLLSLAIVASAVAMVSSGQCRQGIDPWGPAWLMCVVCIVIWTNHLQVAPVRSLRAFALVLGRSAWELVKLIAVFCVAFIPAALVLPTYQCYTDRSKVAEILVATSLQREAIAAHILQRGRVEGAGAGLEFSPSGRAKMGAIRDDGSIVVLSDDPPSALFLTPSIQATEVKWVCQGVPHKAMPLSCRLPAP